MPELSRFSSERPISRGATGGGTLTGSDISRASNSGLGDSVSHTQKDRVAQIRVVQAKMKAQDDSLLAASNSGEYLGQLLDLEED